MKALFRLDRNSAFFMEKLLLVPWLLDRLQRGLATILYVKSNRTDMPLWL
jgi:hypothetical protein